TFDVSFISLRLVVPPTLPFVREGGLVLPMIKPQFEAGRRQVGKGGVVRDPEVRSRVIAERIAELEAAGVEADPETRLELSLRLELLGSCDSPVPGMQGNREAFALFRLERSSSASGASPQGDVSPGRGA
ncbi:MAG: hypothetical protein MI919_38770, partial [Holophagales bacterium]|nr:hypothetical protein [Holophagales bacterium]